MILCDNCFRKKYSFNPPSWMPRKKNACEVCGTVAMNADFEDMRETQEAKIVLAVKFPEDIATNYRKYVNIFYERNLEAAHYAVLPYQGVSNDYGTIEDFRKELINHRDLLVRYFREHKRIPRKYEFVIEILKWVKDTVPHVYTEPHHNIYCFYKKIDRLIRIAEQFDEFLAEKYEPWTDSWLEEFIFILEEVQEFKEMGDLELFLEYLEDEIITVGSYCPACKDAVKKWGEKKSCKFCAFGEQFGKCDAEDSTFDRFRGLDSTLNRLKDPIEEPISQVLFFIRESPGITTQKLAEDCEFSYEILLQSLRKLRSEELIYSELIQGEEGSEAHWFPKTEGGR